MVDIRAGSGRVGGLTDVVRVQLEWLEKQCTDHPNNVRDVRVDDGARCLSQSSQRKRLNKSRKKKENLG